MQKKQMKRRTTAGFRHGFARLAFPLIAATFAAAAPAGAEPKIADTEINLVQQSSFKPVMMHGKPTAAFGWYLKDWPRNYSYRTADRYYSGEECFKLSFADGAITFTFADPVPPFYVKPSRPALFGSRIAWPAPPAKRYRTTARIKFTSGKLSIPSVNWTGKPGPDWQKLDVIGPQAFDEFAIVPESGSVFSFADVKSVAIYPKIGGEIALPEGGKLTRLLLPENADYLTRWGVALWRGWLWKLTGVALPIQTVKEVKPTPGAFAFVKGEVAPGGWRLAVNKDGIVLTAADVRALSPALYDYLRLGLKCAFYTFDCQNVPKNGSVKELPAIEREAKPRFHELFGWDRLACLSGGYYFYTMVCGNDCNYYHSAEPGSYHLVNVVMPKEMYFDKHPEYYMLDPRGKRMVHKNPAYLNPCFTNEEAMKLMVDNFFDYAKGQSLGKRVIFSPGDSPTLCRCEKCVKFNGGIKSNTDSVFDFTNRVLPKLAEIRPDLVFQRDLYVTHHDLPTHVKLLPGKDVILEYTAGHDVFPCTLHVDCEINRRRLAELDTWTKLAGGPQNIGFSMYRDLRPIHLVKMLERLHRNGRNFLFWWIWRGYSPAIPFVMARWNLGEDADKLVEEFDNAYFGKGGKYVHEVDLLVEKYAENYKHTPEELKIEGVHHFCIWGGDLRSRTLLDRPTLDKIYALFDKALEAAKGDKLARRHIIDEKKAYLSEDLIRWNRTTCKTEAELAAFAARIAELIRDAREARFPYTVYGVTPRELLISAAGWDIPDTGKYWADEPAVDKFLAKPLSIFLKVPERIPGGWYFRPSVFEFPSKPRLCNWQCPERLGVTLRRPSFAENSMTAVLPLTVKPAAPLCLAIEGLDDDKKGASLMKVEVNGKKLFEGPNSFKEHEWSRMCFMIPAECLQLGDNEIRISNVTPEKPSRSALFPNDPAKAKTDNQWGWIQISEVVVSDPAGDFANYAAGKKFTLWCQSNIGLKKEGRGKITREGGKAVFTAGTEPLLRFAATRDTNPKIPVNVGGATVRLTITAAGSGKLEFRMQCFLPYLFAPKTKVQQIKRSGFAGSLKRCRTLRSPEFELTAKPKTIVYDFKLPKEAGLVNPEILLIGPGKMTVTNFRFEELPAK